MGCFLKPLGSCISCGSNKDISLAVALLEQPGSSRRRLHTDRQVQPPPERPLGWPKFLIYRFPEISEGSEWTSNIATVTVLSLVCDIAEEVALGSFPLLYTYPVDQHI